MDILIEGKFKGGAVKQPWDSRNYIYDDLVASAGSLEIDWVKGYDIRNELDGGIELKNQGPSSSCVGQGWSYQVWIFQVLEMMEKYNMTLDELRVHHKDRNRKNNKIDNFEILCRNCHILEHYNEIFKKGL